MKQHVYLLAALLLPLFNPNASAQENRLQPRSFLDMSLEQLGTLQFYTASRRPQNIEEIPAVVNVITADEIEKRGYVTLQDALRSVPGFYFGEGALTNRGITQVQNSYLILVDGHSMSNPAWSQTAYTFPELARVERIEVMRSNGSVLWGSQAGTGVINIITPSGSTLDPDSRPFGTLRLSTDYEIEHERGVYSLLYGKKYADGDLMLSLNYFDSAAPATDWHNGSNFATGHTVTEEYVNEANFSPSYGAYTKVNWHDFSFKGQMSRKAHRYVSNELWGEDHKYEENWLEFGYSPELSDSVRMTNRFFHDSYNYTEDAWAGFYYVPEYDTQGETESYGEESVLYYEDEDHEFLIGFLMGLYKQRYFQEKPVIFFPTIVIDESFTRIEEWVFAPFFEEIYRGIDNLQLHAGARLETSRGGPVEETIIMPRVGTVYSFFEDWSAKYFYNNSRVRPNYRYTYEGEDGNVVQGVVPVVQNGTTQSQEFRSHDLQLQYSVDAARYALTISILATKTWLSMISTCM